MEQDRKYVHVVSALRETIKKNGVPREIYIDRETVCQFESEEKSDKNCENILSDSIAAKATAETVR